MHAGDPKAPPFAEGERLTRAAFHARYLLTPEDYHAELIGGVVHLNRRKKARHGETLAHLVYLVGLYQMETSGVQGLPRVTILLDPWSEPQPDLSVILLSGVGRTWEEDDVLAGPPELIVEVADDTEELDLGGKRLDYERAGVSEYLVVLLLRNRIAQFVHQGGRFVERLPASDGIVRSASFPGLWLDTAALLTHDLSQARQSLAAGLASPDHAAFVARLKACSGEKPS